MKTKQKVLFVCTGNTCRSPMAAALATSYGLNAESAGTGVVDGSRAAANAVTLFPSLKRHRARSLSRVNLRSFDTVVCMSADHAAQCQPQGWFTRLLLKIGLINWPKVVTWNVPDPYGQSLDVYEAVRVWMDRNLRQLNN